MRHTTVQYPSQATHHNIIQMKIQFAFLIALSICLLYNCKSESVEESKSNPSEKNISLENPGFIHTVYFWFKENANPQLKEEFITGLDKLAKIKSIQSVYYGPPAGTPRDVVDNSYDYAWITTFKTSADHDAYQIDPIHLEFIERYKELWEEVKV